MNWYDMLYKPALNPPDWIFSPAWTILYILMGISLFLIWKSDPSAAPKERRRGIFLFSIQLFLNIIWSIIFFTFHSPFWALVDLIALWLAIVITIFYFYKISKPAAWLLIPYILWVSFAGYLNYSIWILNQKEPVACTMEAKLCPDGSYVGRIGPKCEFTPCPGATFQYPEKLDTQYIFAQEWPPKLQIIDSAGFSCEQGGLGINGRPNMTIQKKMNNIIYCIDSISEGAAGTFYTDYTYTFLKDNKLIKLSFTLAYPQCGNYDNPKKAECEQERQTFDLDALISHIAESMQF